MPKATEPLARATSGDEDELAARKCRLALPGSSRFCQRHPFALNGAAPGSSVRQNLCESLRFLLACYGVIGIAQDGVQLAAERCRGQARGWPGSRPNVD